MCWHCGEDATSGPRCWWIVEAKIFWDSIWLLGMDAIQNNRSTNDLIFSDVEMAVGSDW